MNDTTTLYTASPEDLVLRVKIGDSEAAMLMGIICLSGLGIKQDIDQAASYFVKAKQLGAKNADEFIAYIHECNDRMIKAIDTYAEKGSLSKKFDSVAERISQQFATVRSKRKRLSKILSNYGLPACPLCSSLNNLLDDLDSGRRTMSDICSIISLTDSDDHWCHDTACLLYEEGDDGLASMWLKKSHPDSDDELLKLLQTGSGKGVSFDLETMEIKGTSLLEKKPVIRILPDNIFTSGDTIKKSLGEWSHECNLRRQSYLEEQRRLEEERQRMIEEERRKAEDERKRKEEEAKRKAEEARRKAEEDAKKRAEERTFIVGRYGRQRDEISDKTVSRQHCRVSLLDDGMVEIENLSQSNGTVINGEKIDKIRTSMDADLKMGNYIIKVRDLFPPRKNPTGPDKQTTA